jgi:hypothetical protein
MWSPQDAVLIVMPPAKLTMPGPPPLFPAPPLAFTLPSGFADPALQAAIASAPPNMNTALERSTIDMHYHRPRKVHMQVMSQLNRGPRCAGRFRQASTARRSLGTADANPRVFPHSCFPLD